MSFTKFRKLSAIVSSNTVNLTVFLLSFWHFKDTNVCSFVIVHRFLRLCSVVVVVVLVYFLFVVQVG